MAVEARAHGSQGSYIMVSLPMVGAMAGAPMVGANAAAAPLAAAPLAGATLEDGLGEGPAAAAAVPTATVPTVEDSEQMERALHARQQQATMAVLHMTEAQVTSLFNYLQSDRPMEHARTIWADVHKAASPKKRARTNNIVAELFRAEAARLARRGTLEASETLRAAAPTPPALVAADDDGDQQQRMHHQQQRIRAYVEQIAIPRSQGFTVAARVLGFGLGG